MAMKKILVFFTLLLSAHAALSDAPLKDASTTALIEKSGLKLQVEKLPEMLDQQLAMMERQGGTLPPERRMRFREAMLKAYDPKVLIFRIKAGLERILLPEDRREIVEFLDSPLGRKIVAAENGAASKEAMENLDKQGTVLMEKLMQDTPRLALIQSLDKATRATDTATNTSIATALATEYGLISQSYLPQKPSFEQLKSVFEKNRLPIRIRMAQMVLTGMAMGYRNLRNEELADYLAFANSTPGKKYFLGVSSVVDHVLVDAASRFGKALGDADKGSI